MTDPGSALVVAKGVDDGIGLLGRYLGKLRAQPDVAAVKLAAALDEVASSYFAVDKALSRFGALALTPDALKTNSHDLAEIAGGRLTVDVEQGMGSCRKIGSIYEAHLKRWFARVFDKQEYEDTQRLFDLLSDADGGLFDDLHRVVSSLHPLAKDVVELLLQDRHDEARVQMKTAYRELADLQTELAAGMSKLYQLKNDFLAIARQA